MLMSTLWSGGGPKGRRGEGTMAFARPQINKTIFLAVPLAAQMCGDSEKRTQKKIILYH